MRAIPRHPSCHNFSDIRRVGTSSRAKSSDPGALPVVSSRDGKPGLANFVRCVAASTPLRFAQNDNRVLPDPRSIRPIRFAFKIDIALRAFRSATIATIPMPMLKT
jgi:hypothetical protein